MSALPHSPLNVTRPFTRADALAAGITPDMLRGSRFRRLFRGVYVDAAVHATPVVRAAGALLGVDADAFASHASAARLHRVPIPTLPEEHVTVLRVGDRRQRTGVRVHVARMVLPGEVVRIDGVRVSSAARMFVELASVLSLVDLVVVGDNLVRHRRLTVEQLVAYASSCSLAHSAKARAAVAYVRAEVDSPMETRLRMLLVLAGLPEPTVNFKVRDETGHVARRFDLTYEHSRTIVEFDGRQHIEREQHWESDLARREEIDDSPYRIVVIVSRGIYVEPERTLRRIAHILRERGEPGVPAVLSDEWRPHFPGRG